MKSKNKNQKSINEIEAQLSTMTYYEAIDYIRTNLGAAFRMLPSQFGQSITALFDKLENDYRALEEEKNAIAAERDALLGKAESNNETEGE